MNRYFQKPPQKPPTGDYTGGLVETIKSEFRTNTREVQIRQELKGKNKRKYFVCFAEKGLFKGYNPQKHSKFFKDYDDAKAHAAKLSH